MKNLIFTLFVLVSMALSAQKISTTRMGDFQIDMSQSEVEKLIGKPVILKNDENDPAQTWGNYAQFTHQNVSYKAYFYPHEEDDVISYKINSIETTSSNIKTLSGLGVGSSLDNLWKAYKNYDVCHHKEWVETEGGEGYERSKTLSVFTLTDNDNQRVLSFHIKNQKVYKIVISEAYEGC